MQTKILEGEILQKDLGGRPTKYEPTICDTIITHFETGMCKVEVCAKLRISTKTFDRWCEKYPEFAEAAELGKTLAEAVNIEKQKDYIAGITKCSQPVLHMNLMKNCYGWDKADAGERNNIKIENLQINQLPGDELERRINALSKKLELFSSNPPEDDV